MVDFPMPDWVDNSTRDMGCRSRICFKTSDLLISDEISEFSFFISLPQVGGLQGGGEARFRRANGVAWTTIP